MMLARERRERKGVNGKTRTARIGVVAGDADEAEHAAPHRGRLLTSGCVAIDGAVERHVDDARKRFGAFDVPAHPVERFSDT